MSAKEQKVEAFETTLQKTYKLLKDIEDALGWEGRRGNAYNALRSVLHAIRDRLTPEAAVHFGAQLPMLVRGFYYEGWNIARVPMKMHADEFLGHIQNGFTFPFDPVEQPPEVIVRAVMKALALSIDPKEIEKIKMQMPKDIAELF